MAHISVGTRYDLHGRGVAHPACFLPHGCNAYLAKAVKESGVKIPVVALGALDDPDVAEGILARGEADMVTIARGTIADPEFANKAREGRVEDIVPCIRCFHCIDRSVGRTNSDAVLRFNQSSTHRFNCSVNPQIGFEHYTIDPPKASRRVAIIGGGPAGMEAAITAAERGHSVTLYEKSGTLGGALIFSDQVSFKSHLAAFKNYLIHRVRTTDINVLLNTEATPELIERGRYDAVIAAVGAEAVRPGIPGIDGENVIMATDAYYVPQEKIGKKIAVVGGGQVGCETGLHFAKSGKDVTIIEMQSVIAPDASFTHRLPLMEQLEENTKMMTNVRCTAITEKGVELEDADGKPVSVEADTVLIAVGMKSKYDLSETFRDTTLNFYRIGDCVRPATVHEAVTTGYNTAIQL